MNTGLSALRLHLRFLGPRVAWLLAIAAATGLLLGLIEIGFAYGLQAFLVALGLLNGGRASIPGWLPQKLTGVLLFVAVTGVLRGLLQGVHYFTQNATTEEVQFLQRSRLLHWALHGESASSSHVTVMFNARAGGAGSLVYSVQGLAVQLVMALLLVGALVALSPVLTLLAALALAAFAPPLLWWDKNIKQVSFATIAQWDKTNSRMLMSIKNLLLLQICGMQDREEALAQESLGSYLRHLYRMFVLTALKLSIPQVAGPLLVCAIALGAHRYELLAASALVTYFYLFLRLIQTFSTANQAFTSLIFGLPHYRALFDWWRLDFERAPRPEERGGAAPLPAAKLGWELAGVTFRYAQAASETFSGLDLRVAPGTTVVVTGPSGAGKSTLLGLLLGTLRPTAGAVRVLVEGAAAVPLSDCRMSLLPRVGYVGPESFLLEGSLEQNITYGLHEAAPRAAVEEALRLAECQFVFDLPKGLEHPLTEQGQGLSAGQKQRLGLARALLRKPTVLILDEATSNLDADTEVKLVDTLARLKGGMTIVAVTHRRELLRIADSHLELQAPAAAPAT